ncbi:MAG: nicotinamide mononucleotide transporter [Gemmatimonadetes bacterium]|nr:nicotinamide mononucleotide transporter [Gemmatimonadota bacterium]
MRTWEAIAATFGIVAVYFNARQNVLGWPIGLVNVGLYTWLFYLGKLYALMGLQVFFAIISLYGWYQWLRGGQQHSGRRVTRTPRPLGLALLAGALAGSAALGWYLDRYTADAHPYLDATVSVVSLAGQWMMARKYLETWLIWIAVNLVSVPLFLVRGEYPTAVQYSVFLALAVNGLVQWRRALTASS